MVTRRRAVAKVHVLPSDVVPMSKQDKQQAIQAIAMEDAAPQALIASQTPPTAVERVRLVLFDDDTRQAAERARQTLHGPLTPPPSHDSGPALTHTVGQHRRHDLRLAAEPAWSSRCRVARSACPPACIRSSETTAGN